MTPNNTANIRRCLRQFDFESLFIEELGWDHFDRALSVSVDGAAYTLNGLAEKRGVVVFEYAAPGEVPPYSLRRKLERQVAASYQEHFILFTDAGRTQQVWQWVRREVGRPLACREHAFRPEQAGDSLIQKLQTITFSLAEEDSLNLVDVTGRLRAAFNVEQATKRFFDQFKSERSAFEGFIQGIDRLEDRREYVSVMLNRLMFVYFIQKKGFLDGDPHYLRVRLKQMQARFGSDQFYSFYRYFLLRLFHDGLGAMQRSEALEALLGKVPYLNGGLFDLHEIERTYPAIHIPDAAFERVLDFFDQYQWHLDDRPLRDDREINPDVLGYIFEKYINQKQMGAYYTKEDITGYISRNTILPHIFETARKAHPAAFKGEASPFKLLQANPRRYIYPAVQHGFDLTLPAEIAAGLDDVNQRAAWNTPADPELALPTEIWRETVARRQRCQESIAALQAGDVGEINDLITRNLDIEQFAQDAIEACDQPETLRAFWGAIRSATILDPTCGSGAFLFAALNVLEPLYEACLAQMGRFVAELPPGAHPHKLQDFKETLAEVGHHPNLAYYILKSIVVNNLYGVDIMAEAVEIARLRLFLKLVAQVERVDQIEPLPDIDFNIRAGNTLVGYATRDDVERALKEVQVGKAGEQGVQSRLFLMAEESNVLEKIEEKAADVERLFQHFRELQTRFDTTGYAKDFVQTKKELHRRLDILTDELNRTLALQYSVDVDETASYQNWLDRYQPFHWFIDFYGIIKRGGFDVVIGNPPYLALNALKDYSLKGYQTIDTRNLYPLVLEKCDALVATNGRQGYIVPVSSVATEGYLSLQKLLVLRRLHISSYDDRPSHLFTGLDKNTLSIILMADSISEVDIISTRLARWNSDERKTLFELLQYTRKPNNKINGCIPKIGSSIEASIWNKLFQEPKALGAFHSRTHKHITFYSRKVNAFLQVLDFVPEVRDGKGGLRPPSEFKEMRFSTTSEANAALCCYNSTLFRWFMDVVSDGSHVNRREVENFPFNPQKASRNYPEFEPLAKELSNQLASTSEHRVMQYQHDTLKVQCIIPKYAKSIIDQVDDLLAKYYGFTDVELDFIRNYDIKYRMGESLHESDDPETDD